MAAKWIALLVVCGLCTAMVLAVDSPFDELDEGQQPNEQPPIPLTKYVPLTSLDNAPSVHVFDAFDGAWESRWTQTGAEGYEGTFEVKPALYLEGTKGNVQLTVPTLARKYGIYRKLDTSYAFDNKDSGAGFVFQYEVQLQDGLDCGGAYVKLVSEPEVGPGFDGSALDAETPYSIMFGPDKCGSESKIHFIIRKQNPVSGKWIEHHMTERPFVRVDEAVHAYTLVIRPDNSFDLLVDGESIRSGSLLADKDFAPPLQPPATIPDPNAVKPDDWIDDEMMPDPDAVKPDDWDDDAPAFIPDPADIKPDGWLDNAPEMVADPDASAPPDWDDEIDGDWEPPMIPNPVCEEVGCGEWAPRQIQNPAFRGKWAAPVIPNPDYVGPWEAPQVPNPDIYTATGFDELASIAGIALELWTMSPNLAFDNILLSSSEADAALVRTEIWRPKYDRHAAMIQREIENSKPKFTDQASDAFNVLLTIALANPLLGLAAALALVLVPVLLCCFCCGGSPQEEFIEVYSDDDDDDTAAANAADNAAADDNANE